MMNHDRMSVYRLMVPDDESPSGGKRSMLDTGVDVVGFKVQATAEVTAFVEGHYGRTFQYFTDDVTLDIRIGDRLVAQDGKKYEVKGVNIQDSGPRRQLEIIMILPFPATTS